MITITRKTPKGRKPETLVEIDLDSKEGAFDPTEQDVELYATDAKGNEYIINLPLLDIHRMSDGIRRLLGDEIRPVKF